jgi:hypothetical protein
MIVCLAIQLLLVLGAAPCLCLDAAHAAATSVDASHCAAHDGGATAPEPGPHAPACPHCDDQGAHVAMTKVDPVASSVPPVPVALPIRALTTGEAQGPPSPALARSPCTASGRSLLARNRVLRI